MAHYTVRHLPQARSYFEKLAPQMPAVLQPVLCARKPDLERDSFVVQRPVVSLQEGLWPIVVRGLIRPDQ
jgi:hypothetical protein